MSKNIRPHRAIAALLAAAAFPVLTHAATVEDTWISITGNWNVAGDWSGGVPSNGTPAGTNYDVFIDGGGTQNSSVTLNVSETIFNLNISTNDKLTFNNNATLTLVDSGSLVSTLQNAGTINIASTGSVTDLQLNATTNSITGAGTILLQNLARIYSNGGVFINSDNLITGDGFVGANLGGIKNQGTIAASTLNKSITIDPSSAGNMSNVGTLMAVSGGTLILSGNGGGTFNNSGGTIEALNGSNVSLAINASIANGTFTTSGNGVIRNAGGSNVTLANLTNTGNYLIDNGSNTSLIGVITNDGSINFGPVDSALGLLAAGGSTVTLGGSGTVTLSSTSSFVRAFIGGTGTFVNSSNFVHGWGNIGNDAIAVINQATMSADTAGGTLTLDPGASGFVNTGTLIAATGTLILSGNNKGTFDSTAGTISVQSTGTLLTPSDVLTAGTVLLNGTWAHSGSSVGTVQFFRGSGTLAVSNSANLTVAANGGTLGTSRVRSLSILDTAKVDLTNHDLIVDYNAGDTDPTTAIRQLLQMSYNGGAWTGPGLTSSKAGLTSGSGKTGLGYLDTAGSPITTFSGQTVDNTAVLIKYTYVGDTNLDGQVDVTDLGNLATRWQQTGNWINGDFNYDGTVNVTDLGLLATNWQQGVTSPQLGTSFQQALAEFGLGDMTVPEPAMMSLIGLYFAGVTVRRRR